MDGAKIMANDVDLISTPFANSGTKNTIPESGATNPQNATMEAGFPTITQTPINEGGIPPERADFNGLGYLTTSHLARLNRGLWYEYDSVFAGRIGGYPINSRVMLENGDIVQSTIPNNTNNPNSNMFGWINPKNIYASNVVDDSGLSQQQVNNGVDSIADLAEIPNPFEGQRVFVKGYYSATNLALSQPFKGGGLRTYVSSRSFENDGFLCINGWVLLLEDQPPTAYHAGAKGDDTNDDTDALQKLFDYSSVTAWQNSGVEEQAWFRKGKKSLVTKGMYRTTKPLLVGTGAIIEFENELGFFSTFRDGAIIRPDFENPLQFAIQSANYDATGNLLPYDKFILGEELDARTYSSTSNISLSNPAIVSKSQIYGAIKLTGSPQSKITNLYANNIDYGVSMSSSWTSVISGRTQHFKAGVCSIEGNHNCKIDGYFNKGNVAVPPLSSGANQMNTDVVALGSSVGVYFGSSQGISSSQLTCEYNDHAIASYWCPTNIQSLYAEKSSIVAITSSASNIKIGMCDGYFNNRDFKVLNNGTIDFDDYQFGNTVNIQPEILAWENDKNRIYAGLGYHYSFLNVINKFSENTIFVSSANGKDNYSGFDKQYPAKTLQGALNTLLSNYTNGGYSFNECKIEILDGSHIVDFATIWSKDLYIKGANGTEIIFNNQDGGIAMLNSNVFIESTTVKANVIAFRSSSGENSLTFNSCIVDIADNVPMLDASNPSTTNIQFVGGSVNGGNLSIIARATGNALLTLTSSATISSEILSRPDKGIVANRNENIIKILPLSLN